MEGMYAIQVNPEILGSRNTQPKLVMKPKSDYFSLRHLLLVPKGVRQADSSLV